MNSICRFISNKNPNETLNIVHFVYETEFHKMRQPFFSPIFYVYLVTNGNGTLKIANNRFPLSVGSLFFSFPNIEYTIDGDDNFTYLYISFYGTRAISLIDSYKITVSNCVFGGFENLIPIWFDAIKRANSTNAHVLSESILLYSLSFICENNDCKEPLTGKKQIDEILVYIQNNFNDNTLSLKKIAGIFSYSEKYLSRLFKSTLGENWNTYLNSLRIKRACKYLKNGEQNIARISALCGYRDTLYFAKVFKKYTGVTPHQFLQGK